MLVNGAHTHKMNHSFEPYEEANFWGNGKAHITDNSLSTVIVVIYTYPFYQPSIYLLINLLICHLPVSLHYVVSSIIFFITTLDE